MDSNTTTSASSEAREELAEYEVTPTISILVSPDGRCYRKDGREFPQRLNKHGYYRISVWDKVRQAPHTLLVHRLVAQLYLSNPEQREVVNHKDGNKKNNDKSNLEWVTLSENSKHALEYGLRTFTPRKNSKRDWKGRFIGWMKRQSWKNTRSS